MIDLTRGFQPGRIIDIVNWHITPRCGYNCGFCGVHNCYYEVKGLNCVKDNVQKLKSLEEKDVHVQTLNITGGDPLLHPHLYDILSIVKEEGFDIWFTTNGSLLNEVNIALLSDFIEGISIPVDCISNIKQKTIGRGYGTHVSDMLHVSDMIHESGIKLGVNTLVTTINYEDNLHSLLRRMDPSHWNVYQTIPGIYQNECIKNMAVTDMEFKGFSRRHSHLRFGPYNEPRFWSKTDMKRKYYFFVDGTIRIH